ncbi:hypothetical protein GCM10023332_24360 [Luteimonas vadosa]|uniref:Uncharacterized protein n=1 Tax=Luteimonas vadosa TaxID=1165507 RepID=A0ABP9E897_9GAMM
MRVRLERIVRRQLLAPKPQSDRITGNHQEYDDAAVNSGNVNCTVQVASGIPNHQAQNGGEQ